MHLHPFRVAYGSPHSTAHVSGQSSGVQPNLHVYPLSQVTPFNGHKSRVALGRARVLDPEFVLLLPDSPHKCRGGQLPHDYQSGEYTTPPSGRPPAAERPIRSFRVGHDVRATSQVHREERVPRRGGPALCISRDPEERRESDVRPEEVDELFKGQHRKTTALLEVCQEKRLRHSLRRDGHLPTTGTQGGRQVVKQGDLVPRTAPARSVCADVSGRGLHGVRCGHQRRSTSAFHSRWRPAVPANLIQLSVRYYARDR